MKINVYCVDKGWLFRDLCYLFQEEGALITEEPMPDADAWICIRTNEWSKCPDPSRLVLQVHDMWPHDLPRSVGVLVRSHPDQREIPAYRSICRPLGALRDLVIVPRAPDYDESIFTAGWVGRPVNLNGEVIRSPQPFVDAMKKLQRAEHPVKAIFMGQNLLPFVQELHQAGVETEYYPREACSPNQYAPIYARMKCLVITSKTEAGPMPLFEALACGIPVLSTPVGWAPQLLDGKNGWTWTRGLDQQLLKASGRQFAQRARIRQTAGPHWLNGRGGWIEEQVDLARLLAARC